MKIPERWRPEILNHGKDALSGADIYQLTSAAAITHDIYCEERYTSADGTRVACLRSIDGMHDAQLWVIDLNTGNISIACDSIVGFPTSPLDGDDLFFIRPLAKGRTLCRLNLKTFEYDEIFDMTKCPQRRSAVCSVSPDGRWFVSNTRLSTQFWGFYRIDLHNGTWNVFHEHKDICNPHPQFNPANPREIMVQHNRGCVIDDNDNIVTLVGEEGATLYLIDIEGNVTRRLPVGAPHTPAVTGHECWVAKSSQILLSTVQRQLHLLAPGAEKSRVLWKGIDFSHVSASNDGKYFISDHWPNGVIYVGSLTNGRLLPLCNSGASCNAPQHTHTHAYMTPDNKFVIFNSDRSGLGQVWAAKLPPGFLQILDEPV